MNEIKVTVTYEKPTTSKFDALMAEYEAAKKYADETVSYYKPLADVAEEAKFAAIMEQLETIKGYAKRIYDLSENKNTVRIKAVIPAHDRGAHASGCLYFDVGYHGSGNFYVTWDQMSFNMARIRSYRWQYCEGDRNILGKWNEWRVYERLEEEACRMMKALISSQASRAEKQVSRLNNIVNGGN